MMDLTTSVAIVFGSVILTAALWCLCWWISDRRKYRIPPLSDYTMRAIIDYGTRQKMAEYYVMHADDPSIVKLLAIVKELEAHFERDR